MIIQVKDDILFTSIQFSKYLTANYMPHNKYER